MRQTEAFQKNLKPWLTAIAAVLIFCPSIAVSAEPEQPDAQVSAPSSPIALTIQQEVAKKTAIDGVKLHSIAYMRSFYKRRSYEPLWSGGFRLNSQAKELMGVIETVDLEGLKPEFYHEKQIFALRDGLKDQEGNAKLKALANLDLLLTDAFFLLVSHLTAGLIHPYNFREQWFNPPKEIDLGAILETATSKNAVRESLDQLKPHSTNYRLLRDALAKYRTLAASGGWPTLPAMPKLPKDEKMQVGQRNPWVKALRRRLEATEGLKGVPPELDDAFDADVERAIVEFQKTQGLNPDGVVGKWSFDALNKTTDERICQIIIGLDHQRAMNRKFSEQKNIIVNVPAFEVWVFENGKRVLDMKAIVGKWSDKTPLMSDIVEYIVFSPKWHVPESIAIKEELGKLQEDPTKFRRRGMKVYHGEGKDKVEIEYENYDWSQVSADNFEYHFVQDPGGGNALGKIKFLFPNNESVYLHDTPTKPLFEKEIRAFSHGCVRIEKPIEFAEFLLRSEETWDSEKIKAHMNRGREMYHVLKEKVPIHLIYMTSWVDDDGRPQFRRDLYNYDQRVRKVLCR